MIDSSELGNALAVIRVMKRIRQCEVAEKSGMSSSYLSEIEKGRKIPSIAVLDSIAAALGIKLSYLVKMGEEGTLNSINELILKEASR